MGASRPSTALRPTAPTSTRGEKITSPAVAVPTNTPSTSPTFPIQQREAQAGSSTAHLVQVEACGRSWQPSGVPSRERGVRPDHPGRCAGLDGP
jgi:hypothetical protein